MENLPSVGARCPHRSGRKSGCVRRHFFGGLSPLRGPLASATAGSSIAKPPPHDKRLRALGATAGTPVPRRRERDGPLVPVPASSQPPALVDVALRAHLADLNGDAVSPVGR